MTLRALVSFAFYGRTDLAQLVADCTHDGVRPQLFGDSGAFTVRAQGHDVSVAEYADWLDANAQHLAAYANLDVIGDHVASARNLRALERRGLQPVPVWHAVSPPKVLRDLVRAYRYVAIGGMTDARAFDRFMAHAVSWHRMAVEHGCSLHGFGMSDWRIISLLPWYSCDSSAIGSGYRYGGVRLYDRRAKRWRVVRLGDRAAWGRAGPLVREWGFDPEDFIDRQRYHRTHAVALGILSWQAAEADLRRRFGELGVRRNGPPAMGTTAPGLHLYAADGSGLNVTDMALAVHLGRWSTPAFAHRRRAS